jgi:hypothetical protein
LMMPLTAPHANRPIIKVRLNRKKPGW